MFFLPELSSFLTVGAPPLKNVKSDVRHALERLFRTNEHIDMPICSLIPVRFTAQLAPF